MISLFQGVCLAIWRCDRALLAAFFLVPCASFFAFTLSVAYLLYSIIAEAIGMVLALGGGLSLFLVVGIGAVGIRKKPFHSATLTLLILGILLLACRIVLPFHPVLGAIGLFAVSQTMVFGASGSLFGILDAIAPLAIREQLYRQLMGTVLFGFFTGAWLAFIGVATSSILVPVDLACLLTCVSIVILGRLSSRPVAWAPQLGKRAMLTPPPVGSLVILRQRGSLVTLAAVTAFLAFALLTQMCLLILQLFSNQLALNLHQWIYLITLLGGCGAGFAWLVFVVSGRWIRRIGPLSLFALYPLLMIAPLIWWIVVPDSLFAAIFNGLFSLIFFSSFYVSSTRFVVTVLPSISTRGALLLINGLAGALGIIVGPLSWLGLQPYMPYPVLVRTTAVLDGVLLGLSIALTLSYRWHWLDRLQHSAWGFHLNSKVWMGVKEEGKEIEAWLKGNKREENELGLIMAAHDVAPQQFLPTLELLLKKRLHPQLEDRLTHYLGQLPLETLEALTGSPIGQMKAYSLGAALLNRVPIRLDRLTLLLRDLDPWVQLLACIAGWRYGLEELANVTWMSMDLMALEERTIMHACRSIPPDMPLQGVKMLRALTRSVYPAVRAIALEQLAVVVAFNHLVDPSLETLALDASTNDQPKVRQASGSLLAAIGTKAAIERLGELLSDPSSQVANAAGKALARCNSEGMDLALNVLGARYEQSSRAAISVFMLREPTGERMLTNYVNAIQANALEACFYRQIVPQKDERWAPFRIAVEDRYHTLIGQYSWITLLRGFPSIGFALRALSAYGPLWSEAATGILSHWIVPGPYLRRAVELTRVFQQRPIEPSPLSREKSQQMLTHFFHSPEPWLAVGALLTHYNLFGALPSLPSQPHPRILDLYQQLSHLMAIKNTESLFMHRILFLKTVTLFRGMSLDDLALLDRKFVIERFKAGEIIYNQGEPGVRIYIVYRGSVNMTRRVDNETEHVIHTIKAGEHFGDISMLEEAPRYATAIANEETELLSLSREEFVYLITERPEILFPLTTGLGRRFLSLLDEFLKVKQETHSSS